VWQSFIKIFLPTYPRRQKTKNEFMPILFSSKQACRTKKKQSFDFFSHNTHQRGDVNYICFFANNKIEYRTQDIFCWCYISIRKWWQTKTHTNQARNTIGCYRGRTGILFIWRCRSIHVRDKFLLLKHSDSATVIQTDILWKYNNICHSTYGFSD